MIVNILFSLLRSIVAADYCSGLDSLIHRFKIYPSFTYHQTIAVYVITMSIILRHFIN